MTAPRKFTGSTLVIASHNKGKVGEIHDLLRPLGIEVVSAAELDLAEPEETGATFIANAELKARAAAGAAKLPCLADDSGLAVDALNGDPGIYSARWAGPKRDFRLAMERSGEEAASQRRQRTPRPLRLPCSVFAGPTAIARASRARCSAA